MEKVMMRLSVVVLVVAVMAAAVQAETTVTYKQGTADPFTALNYTGQDDARIIGFNPDHAHGADGEILLKNTLETPDGRSAGLVRFDISTMPAGQTITNAKLRLYVESLTSGTFDVKLYKMLRTWVENTATWNEWDYSGTGANAWDAAGATGAADVSATVSGAAVTGPGASYYEEWTITNLVADWYNAPAGNHGVRVWSDDLVADDYDHVNFWGDEFAEWGRPELVITYAPIVVGTVRTWVADSLGDWNDVSNWDVAEAPDANTHTAVFGGVITSARTVVADTAVTVKAVQFDNASTYVIAGAGSVNLEADTGNASVTVAQGDHEFQVRVNLAGSTDVDVSAGASLSFNNKLDLAGNTLTKTGDGTLNINNTLVLGTGGSVVGLGGTIGGGGSIGGNLVNTSATVAPGASPAALTVEGDFSQAAGGTLAIELEGTAAGEFDVLAVGGSATLGGSLDIGGSYAGSGADSWVILTASGGITGGFASITAGYEVALANGDTELVLSLSGLTPGDANGDGHVDLQDFGLLKANFGTTSGATWAMGDFNGDGEVDLQDFGLLKANFGTGGAAVPEPATLSLLAIGGLGLIRRRRS